MKPHYKDIIKCLNMSFIVFYPVNCGPLIILVHLLLLFILYMVSFVIYCIFFVYKLTMIRGVIELS